MRQRQRRERFLRRRRQRQRGSCSYELLRALIGARAGLPPGSGKREHLDASGGHEARTPLARSSPSPILTPTRSHTHTLKSSPLLHLHLQSRPAQAVLLSARQVCETKLLISALPARRTAPRAHGAMNEHVATAAAAQPLRRAGCRGEQQLLPGRVALQRSEERRASN